MEKIILAEKFAVFTEPWQPKVIAGLNGQEVKVVRLRGPFTWHHHEHEDELFLVWRGGFRMEFQDRPAVELRAGDCLVSRAAWSIVPSPTRRRKSSFSSPPGSATRVM